ncbi:MAG: polysaccharide deacetylase family protein [Coriobacteriales bacterium]|nr:polysaccharide deacetylase family protein [Coriobacteriales bacterium]
MAKQKPRHMAQRGTRREAVPAQDASFEAWRDDDLPRHEQGEEPTRESDDQLHADDSFVDPLPAGEGIRTPTYSRQQLESDRRRREEALEGVRPRHHGRKLLAIVLVLVALGAALGLCYHVWLQIPITVIVDGKQVRTDHQGTTVQTLFEQTQPDVTAGNLLSVTGDVLTQGGGDAYEATVNGNAVSPSDASGYAIKANDQVSFQNGSDVTESYTVGEQTTVQPKLRMEGNEGVIFYVKQWGKPTVTQKETGDQSGQSIDAVVSQGQDLVVERANVHPADGQKLVALTFDDGPSEYTQKYLDILNQYGAKATFCELGQQIQEDPDASKAVVDAGMQLVSHTWDHQQLTRCTAEQVKSELDQSFQEIQSVTGVTTTTLRQPYGSMNANVWLYSGGSMSVAAFWTHDSEDWRRPGPDAIVANCTSYFQPGSIILMHDGGGNRDQDVDALPKIIQAWQAQGYTFVTLSELLDSDPDIPDDIASCQATMPSDAVWPTEIASDSANNAIP